jgi:hypothetical protein
MQAHGVRGLTGVCTRGVLFTSAVALHTVARGEPLAYTYYPIVCLSWPVVAHFLTQFAMDSVVTLKVRRTGTTGM